MKKVAIITFHTALNYGALLQAFALQQTLNDIGNMVEILDYRNPVINKMYYYPRIFERKNIRDIFKFLFQGRAEIQRRKKFDAFRKDKLTLSSNQYSDADIGKVNEVYDLFITGSDQVWNYTAHGFDKNYFLSFVTSSEKKRSYAASIGLDKLPDSICEEYRALLQDYKMCSVREKQGLDLLSKIGIQNVRQDLDPVFLLNKDEWLNRLSIRRKEENYIFAYYFQLTATLKKFIEDLSNETGYYVVYMGSAFKAPFSCKCKGLRTADPIDFVTAVFNAKYVVTNSFHGTAFSINFNKTFFIELLKEDSQVNSRLINILKETNLMERQIDKFDSVQDALQKNIPWNAVNTKVEKLRDNSMLYIQEWMK